MKNWLQSLGLSPIGIDLYQKGCFWLLMKTAGTSGHEFTPAFWQRAWEARGSSVDFLFFAFKMAQLLPHPSEKARVRRSLQAAFVYFQVPPPRTMCIKLAHPSFEPVVKGWLRNAVALVSPTAPWRASSMRLGTRVVAFHPCLVKQALFSAPSAFRNFTFDYRMASHDYVKEALAGSDMLRLPASTKVPMPQSSATVTSRQLASCNVWLDAWALKGNPNAQILPSKLQTQCSMSSQLSCSMCEPPDVPSYDLFHGSKQLIDCSDYHGTV